jgi:hypothetical protein
MAIKDNKELIILVFLISLGTYWVSTPDKSKKSDLQPNPITASSSPTKFNLIGLEKTKSCYQFMTSKTATKKITSLHCNLNSVVGNLQDVDRPSEVGKTNTIELAIPKVGEAYLVVFDDESNQTLKSIPIIIDEIVNNGANYHLANPLSDALIVGMSGAPIVQSGEVVGSQSGISQNPKDSIIDPKNPGLAKSKAGFMTTHLTKDTKPSNPKDIKK